MNFKRIGDHFINLDLVTDLYVNEYTHKNERIVDLVITYVASSIECNGLTLHGEEAAEMLTYLESISK